jgi:GTPase-activating protein BEM2
VFLLQFDHRGIRDEAIREASQHLSGAPSSAKKMSRPFHRLVIAQQEKNRRDKHLRTRLQKEKLQEQLKLDKRDEQLTRGIRPRKQGTAAQKQHRNKKSMSAFLHFMRPISSAFGADTSVSSPGTKKTAAELDFMPNGKPSLVLSLVDAHVAQFINTERSFTFQLDTEDGGHYLLQAMNRRDMMKWIETINQVTKMAAKRRLTYLGNSPKARVSDHIHDPIVASRDPMAGWYLLVMFVDKHH